MRVKFLLLEEGLLSEHLVHLRNTVRQAIEVATLLVLQVNQAGHSLVMERLLLCGGHLPLKLKQHLLRLLYLRGQTLYEVQNQPVHLRGHEGQTHLGQILLILVLASCLVVGAGRGLPRHRHRREALGACTAGAAVGGGRVRVNQIRRHHQILVPRSLLLLLLRVE